MDLRHRRLARPPIRSGSSGCSFALARVGVVGGVAVAKEIGDRLARALLGGEIRDGDTVLVDRPYTGDTSGLTVTRA